MKTLFKVGVVCCLLAVIALVVLTGPMHHASAQSNYGSFKDTGNGLVTSQPWCFEALGNGQDVCILRKTAGHINFLTGTLAANKDVVGTCTAAASTTCTVTFTTAFTAAPVCVVTDQTTAANNALRAAPTTTTLTITTTSSSDVFSYVCFGS